MKKYLIFICFFSCSLMLWGQTPVEVPLSATVQVVNDQAYFFHPVRKGQTLYSISRAYGVSQELLLSANPDLAHGLRADQIIRIPASVHLASPRETVFGISQMYGLDMGQLRALNPALYEKDLQIGQKLYIPGLKGSLAAESHKPDTDKSPRSSETEAQQSPPAGTYLFVPAPPQEVRISTPAECPEASYKDEYHVALLIPLFLNEMEASLRQSTETMVHIPGDPPEHNLLPLSHPSFSFLPYYQGVMIALDSIRGKGADVKLHVFDVGLDVSQAYQLTRENSLIHMDLIIGPFYRAPMEHIAAHALQYNIPVVSPLHADKSQLHRFPNLYKVTPSMDIMLNNLARYIANHYPDEHIMLIHNNQPQARELISGFMNHLKSDIQYVSGYQDSLHLARINGYFLDDALIGNRVTNLMVMSDSLPDRYMESSGEQILPANVTQVIFDEEGQHGIINKMKKHQTNVLVTLIGGEAFLSNYLRELSLNAQGYDIIVMGIPDWERYQNIEIDYLQDLKVHIFTPDFYDYQDPHIQNFIKAYRAAYSSEPHPDALKAGQTTWFFLDALSRYGTAWPECIHLLNNQGLFSPFDFRRTLGEEHGWENKYSTIYMYQDFRLLDVHKRHMPGKTANEGR